MARFCSKFYIVGSSTGHVIGSIKQNRNNFGHGPYVKVHSEVVCVSSGDAAILEYLYIPKVVQKRDKVELEGVSHIRVKMVEVSSWAETTTKRMHRFFFDASKLNVHKATVDVVGLIGGKDVSQVMAMVIGTGGRYLKSVVKKDAKVYTQRGTAPNVFVIEAYSQKKLLGVKIRLEKAIRKVHADLVAKQHGVDEQDARPSGAGRTPVACGGGSFASLAYDDEPPVVNTVINQLIQGEERDNDYRESWPAIDKDATPRQVDTTHSPKTTLAEMLEDAAVRGETFKEELPTSSTPPTSDSDYGDMPPLTKGVSVDDFFASAGASPEWS